MNERIKELIMESVNFRLDPDSHAYEAQVCPEDLEYLVELIVLECIKMIKNEAAQYAEPVWAFELVNDIKDQFGVEE